MMIRREMTGQSGGFTLMEMLVVLLIASIVLMVMGVLAKSTFDVMRTGESRSQLNASAQLSLDYLARDIESATCIPPMNDRNLTGIPDDDVREHDQAARWILGYEVGSSLHLPTNYAMSEAFSDHIKLSHSSQYRIGFDANIISEKLSPPKDLKIQGMRVVNYDSYYRVAIPTEQSPYYMSTIDFNRTYIPANCYPQSVAIGFRDETAVLTQNLDIRYRPYEAAGESNIGVGYERPSAELGDYVYRFLNQPIGTNITRLRLEYFMEVPVYKVDASGDVAYRNLATGDTSFENAPTVDSGGTRSVVSNSVPIIDHYELRHIDVCDNSVTVHRMTDQYLPPGDIGDASAYGSWNIDFFWNDPADNPDNPPRDHYAWTTDGEFRAVRYDTEYLTGQDNSSPTGWDAGNADGIPDGDGIPDDPVPTYWLPYLRAVRATVVATPTRIIEERRNMSGTVRNGITVYYNLDSPVPYRDSLRTVPMYSARDLYIGDGKDIVMTKMIYPEKMFRLDLIINPTDSRLMGMRRADWNYFRGIDYTAIDPIDPDDRIRPITPGGKYYEKENR